jgi:hypothetical protein
MQSKDFLLKLDGVSFRFPGESFKGDRARGNISDLTFETGPDAGDDLNIYKITDENGKMMPGIYFENTNYNSYKGKNTGGTFKIVAYIDKDGITKCRKQKTTFNKPELRLDLILSNGDSVGVKFNINDSTEDNDQKYNRVVKVLKENNIPISTQLSDCNNMQTTVSLKGGATKKKKCIKQSTKKYKTRSSPPFPANQCKNKRKKGNDNKYYVSRRDKNGVYRWKKAAKSVKKK